MSFRYTITVGVEMDMDSNPVQNRAAKERTLRRQLAQAFGGYSETLNIGGWINGNNELVEEESYTYTIIDIAENAAYYKLKREAEFARELFHQASVLITVEVLNGAEFVENPL